MSEPAPRTHIGHVHLKVSDLERAVAFYRDVLGMEITTRYGNEAAFMSYGGYHHHLGLNTWHSKGAPPAPARSAGLYHFAILYPSRQDLANALKRVLDRGWHIDGASDHGVSQALYLHDPDHNGIELYWDRPRDQWPRHAGEIHMPPDPLDVQALLAEAD